MKKMVLILAVLVLMVMEVQAAPPVSVVLADNTLVTRTDVLTCMKKSDTQAMVKLTGTIGDTFVIYHNGVAVTTETLVATSELYTNIGGISSLKIDATYATTGSMELICYKPEQP